MADAGCGATMAVAETPKDVGSAQARAATPASKVVFECGGFLFCGQRREGGFDFPGGKAQGGEDPRECAEREIAEETHLTAEAALRTARILRGVKPVCFRMELQPRAFDVSVFAVRLREQGVRLSPEGERELRHPAWRPVEEVLQDLRRSRFPRQAGIAYAGAVECALRHTPGVAPTSTAHAKTHRERDGLAAPSFQVSPLRDSI